MPCKAPLFLSIRDSLWVTLPSKEAKGSRVQEPTMLVSTVWARVGRESSRTLTSTHEVLDDLRYMSCGVPAALLS